MDTTTTPDISIDGIQSWLVARISEATGLHSGEIDVQAPFATYGLDSIYAVGLSGDLEVWLGVELSPTLMWDYPTIADLAQHLREEVERQQGTPALSGGN